MADPVVTESKRGRTEDLTFVPATWLERPVQPWKPIYCLSLSCGTNVVRESMVWCVRSWKVHLTPAFCMPHPVCSMQLLATGTKSREYNKCIHKCQYTVTASGAVVVVVS